jgi:hypothetical protein
MRCSLVIRCNDRAGGVCSWFETGVLLIQMKLLHDLQRGSSSGSVKGGIASVCDTSRRNTGLLSNGHLGGHLGHLHTISRVHWGSETIDTNLVDGAHIWSDILHLN